MIRPRLGNLLATVVIALCGGMALAQEAPGGLGPPSETVGNTTAALPPAAPQAPVSWTLRVADQNKKKPAQLLIQTADGMQATCAKLAFQIGGGNKVTLSAEGKQVVVRAEHLAASADCVRRSGPEGASLSLEGHVRMHYSKKGQRAEVTAVRAGINLVTEHVDCDLGDTGTKKTDLPIPSAAPVADGVGIRFDSPHRTKVIDAIDVPEQPNDDFDWFTSPRCSGMFR